jgi:hypothetical protein
MTFLVAMLSAAAMLLSARVSAACSEVAAVQATVGASNLLDGSVPWLCVPPQGEIKLGKLDLSLASDATLPFNAQYRSMRDVDPAIAIVCQVPFAFAASLLTGGGNVKLDVTNLTVTCIGPAPDKIVYFAMKDRILVGPPPECKKLQISDNNGTYAAADYTGTAGPPCGVTEAPATTAGGNAPGTNSQGQQVGATNASSSLMLALTILIVSIASLMI